MNKNFLILQENRKETRGCQFSMQTTNKNPNPNL